MDDDLLNELRTSVLDVTGLSGKGVLVAGTYVITAAHCVRFKTDGSMVLGDHFFEEVRTPAGRTFRLEVLAVEPVSDIAVLGELSIDELGEEKNLFDSFREGASFIRLCLTPPPVDTLFPVYSFDHFGKPCSGTASFRGRNPRAFSVEWESPVRGGASGGPIFSADRELLGIISNASESENSNGIAPFLAQALPRWVVEETRESIN